MPDSINMTDSTKSIEQAQELSLQSRATEKDRYPGGSFLLWLAHSGELIAPWWSRDRDADLDTFVKSSDHVSGSVGLLIDKVSSIPVRVLPRDTSVKAHLRQADEFTIRLVEESEFGQGWQEVVGLWLLDYWSQDNGGFFEVIGEGTRPLGRKASYLKAQQRRESGIIAGPIVGPAQGLAHLDASRCVRTGDVDFPVIYTDPDGHMFKYHRTRVAFASSMPSSREAMNRVGFCSVSRWLNYAQSLVDIGIYKQEKLGSRPKRAFLLGKRISTEIILNAVRIADEQMDNRGFRRFAQNPVIGDLAADADLSIVDVASLPDGFDESTWVRLGMFTGALAFGVPIRWLWPAAVTGATKADAMFQHIAGLGGGVGAVLQRLTVLLGGDPRGPRHSVGKFLPPHLKLVFDFQDDEQDRSRAEIKQIRAKTWQINLGDGLINNRVAREQMVEAGDLTRTQFGELELAEGRLPDGSPILSLFSSTDDTVLGLLDLSVEEPLAVDLNDPFQMSLEIDAAAMDAQDVLTNATSATEKEKARQALTALAALKALYQPLVQQGVQLEMEAQALAEEKPEERVSEKQTEGMQFDPSIEIVPEKLSEDRKQFDFGAQVGEIIRGRLARGEAGRFVNIEQLKAQLLEGIRSRLAGRRGAGGRVGAAAAKRAANRAAVAEKLSLDPGLLDTMQSLRQGEEVDATALLKAGLAQVNEDGSVTMTSAGRSLLSAASGGDVDRAKSALAKAGKPKRPRGRKPKGERERERQRELAENRTKVAEALGDIGDDMGALQAFRDGQPLDSLIADRLARAGLTEISIDGEPRLTASGRAMLRAADRGDMRTALDVVSRAGERVDAILDRASRKRKRAEHQEARAAQLGEQADQYDAEADDFDAQADELEADNGNVEKITQLREQAEAMRQRAEDRRVRAEEAQAKAEQAEQEAERLEAQVGGVPEGTEAEAETEEKKTLPGECC